MPPGFGAGGFAPQDQQNGSLFQPGNDRVSSSSQEQVWGQGDSSWGLDSNFSSLPVGGQQGSFPIQDGTQGGNDKSNAPSSSGNKSSAPVNYAAAAASGAWKNSNSGDVSQGGGTGASLDPTTQGMMQASAAMNRNLQLQQQQFNSSWIGQGMVNSPPGLSNGPNPLSQLAAQQKELIKLQENLMQMMQSQAKSGFQDPQVFMDLRRQQAIATSQLQSMQDAFRMQTPSVPSFPNSQAGVSALGSWPLRQTSAPAMLGLGVSNDFMKLHSGNQPQQGSEPGFYSSAGQAPRRDRFNSNSSTGSGGSFQDRGSSGGGQQRPMSYGAVAAAGVGVQNRGQGGYSSSRPQQQHGGGGDKRNQKRESSPKVGSHDRRSAPEIPNEKDCLEGREKRTTLMVRNIPNKYTQSMLLEELNEVLHRKFDFFYLPIDFRKKTNMGYAFINMIDPVATATLVRQFHGKGWRSSKSEKICQISYARIQGKHSLVEQFRNSTVMSKKKQYRPIIFYSVGPSVGTSEPFPPGNSSQKPNDGSANKGDRDRY